MSVHRIELQISDDLDARIESAARRHHLSKEEWVHWAVRQSLGDGGQPRDPASAFERLGHLNAPTADIDAMLEEIERGRC